MPTAATQPISATPVYTDFQVHAPEAMRFVYEIGSGPKDAFERDALALYPYVVQGRLSTGRVAEITGSNRRAVMDFYETNNLPWLMYDEQDLEDDLNTMQRLGVLSEGA